MKEQNQEQRPKKTHTHTKFKRFKIIMKPIKKPQYPNWEHQEIVCLVQAKEMSSLLLWMWSILNIVLKVLS
jgi:hypothetical protein